MNSLLTTMYDLFYDNSMKDFERELCEKMQRHVYHIDFEYTNILYKNNLYKFIENYDISSNEVSSFIKKFNAKHPQYKIINIKNIKYFEYLSLDPSHNFNGTGTYYLYFSVYFD